ncbi:hypothetical protein SLNWT_2715 [Streptomyces albus]|uniref:Uncharacterized protein n=1 Tax=Streptomyces albus (strain ATCC 21838 / DSM 41398 / FERM P-419 / JCM 4703 / NBRC 107858) TaxID=1081613 RepID=A0A0B5EWN7_STRA4|nr:hypothetical protein SLNWT_2715 [Streptomyces albus]AOU77401.1 hypothetical protein SLNHY_2710 [Streptomyces albus]AYN33175.1 hypothetical protein DUI70_2674 [Streptomyces albus]
MSAQPPPDAAPPEDYRLLVPRDWFRVDLTQERWRPELKKFVDQQAARKKLSAQSRQGLWTSLRNTAESSVAHGSLEFFLKADASPYSATPATLLISLLPMPGDLYVSARDWAPELAEKRTGTVTVEGLTAGEAVRIATASTLDYYVEMPGRVGYLVLAFSVPLSGIESPMGELCEAIASSLRWV